MTQLVPTSTKSALSPWAVTTIGALRRATDADRREIGARACAEAVADAEALGNGQERLFEKLLVIDQEGLYAGVANQDGTQRYATMQQFMKVEIAPRVSAHRATLHKLQRAVAEARRLVDRFGEAAPNWTRLALLARETERRKAGKGRLDEATYEDLSRRVAAGLASRRELAAALQGPAKAPGCPGATPSSPTRPKPPSDPMARFAEIAAAQREPMRANVGRLLELGAEVERLIASFDRVPLDGWRAVGDQLTELRGVIGSIESSAGTLRRVLDQAAGSRRPRAAA